MSVPCILKEDAEELGEEDLKKEEEEEYILHPQQVHVCKGHLNLLCDVAPKSSPSSLSTFYSIGMGTGA